MQKDSKPSERLHVDVLEKKFGPITAKVLQHNYKIRAAHLVDAKGFSRTFAFSVFPKSYPLGELDIVGAKIRRGATMGEALHEYGFSVRRNILLIDIMEIPEWLRRAFEQESTLAKFRLSEFLVRKPFDKMTLFAHVIEIFPEVFQKPQVTAHDWKLMNPPMKKIEAEGISDEELWVILGKNNNWNEQEEVRERIRKESLAEITEIFDDMKNCILRGFS